VAEVTELWLYCTDQYCFVGTTREELFKRTAVPRSLVEDAFAQRLYSSMVILVRIHDDATFEVRPLFQPRKKRE